MSNFKIIFGRIQIEERGFFKINVTIENKNTHFTKIKI